MAFGSFLIVLSIVVFFAIFVGSFVGYAVDSFDLTYIPAGTSETMHLDAHEYTVYSSGNDDPQVTISGGPDKSVEVLRSDTTDVTTVDGESLYTSYFFDVDTAGTYVVSNDGTRSVSIGPSDFGRLSRGSLIAFIAGTALGLPGVIMIIVTLIRRSGSRKRLPPATATYAGVPLVPGQVPGGAPPPGWGPQPPGPYGNLPPGPYGGGPTRPTGPPPSNWPGN